MKKYTLFIVAFLTISLSFAQTSYTKGFNTGYKKGFCHDQGIGCIEPIPPISPIPKIGESSESYNDGYNRGFQTGLNARKSNYSTTNRTRYKTAKPKFVDDIIYKAPVDKRIEALNKLDKQHESNLDYARKLKRKLNVLKQNTKDPLLIKGLNEKFESILNWEEPHWVNIAEREFIKIEKYLNEIEGYIRNPYSYTENKSDNVFYLKAKFYLRKGKNYNYAKIINQKASQTFNEIIYTSIGGYSYKVRVISEKDGWSNIITIIPDYLSGKKGWVKTEYILKREQKNYFNKNDKELNSKSNDIKSYTTTFDNPIFEVSLYSEPNVNSKVRYKCPKKSKVKVTDNSGKLFYKVVVDGYSGYVTKHLLKRQW